MAIVIPANFNILTQCPQVYLYILSVIISVVLSVRLGLYKVVLTKVVIGVIMTIVLMGTNFCSWNFQFITWIFAILWVISIIADTSIIFSSQTVLDKYKADREKMLNDFNSCLDKLNAS